MAKRIKRYIAYIDKLLENDDLNYDEEIKRHLVQIQFFMHERLIHLIVTVLFALATIICCLVFIMGEQLGVLAIAIALMVLLIPYIKHYYLLENSVQYMYKQYDRMMEKAGHIAFADKEN